MDNIRFLIRNNTARHWHNIFKVLKEKSQPRILYMAKVSFENKSKIKMFSDIQKVNNFFTKTHTTRNIKNPLGRRKIIQIKIWIYILCKLYKCLVTMLYTEANIILNINCH